MPVRPDRKARMGVVAAVVYITIAAIGMAYSARQGITYGNADMLDAFWPFLIVLNLVNVGFVVRCFGWTNVGFGRLQVRQMVWFLPFLALLAYKWVVALGAMSAFPAKSPEWGRFAYFGAVIVMVGIGEELAFRGILLHSFLGEGASRGRVALAMLVSAVGFSLLHSINYFGGESLPATVEQMGYTFLWGLMFAPLMLRLKSIVPLMVAHWLWDFVQFTVFLSGEMAIIKYDGLQYPIELGMGLVLWFLVLKDHGKPGAA